jgi:AraC-like DNA-binding protein
MEQDHSRDICKYIDNAHPIIVDFCNNVTQKCLAKKYGRSVRAINSFIARRKLNKFHTMLMDKEWLFNQLRKGRTFDEIADELHIYRSYITKVLKVFGVNGHIWQQLRAEGKSGKKLDKEEIKKLYLINKLPTLEIARIYGYIGDEAIRKFMCDNGIRVRLDGEGNIKHNDPEWLLRQLNDINFLRQEYLINKKSSLDIAKDLNCNPELVQRYLHKYNIPFRNILEYQSVRKPSKIHSDIVVKYFDEHNIKHNTFIYKGKYNHKNRIFEIDEYLPDYKIFIEVQGEHWHGLKRRHWCFQRVRSKMWSDLIKYLCVTRDYPDHKFIYLSESEIRENKWVNKIFPNKNNIIFNCQNYKFKICERNEIRDFVIKHHYLQSMTNGRYYGLYYKSELVAAGIVSVPTRNGIKLSDGRRCMELTRLVANDLSKNGLSFFLGKLLRTECKFGTIGIVAFADVSPVMKGQHFGSIYKATNFKFVQMTGWNYRYINSNGIVLHKKVIYNRAIKDNISERNYAQKHDWHKIPEWPKLKFEYILNGGGSNGQN